MKMQMLVSCLSVLVGMNGHSMECEPQMKEIECSIQPIDRSKIHPNGNYATIQSMDPNWSGYVVAADFSGTNADGTVTYVQGSWLVPMLMPTTDTSSCSIWLGMDGYQNGTVERMGTSHYWIDGVQKNHIWFELYPNNSYEIINFPIDTGDRMSAKVAYKKHHRFKLIISNITQGVSFTVPIRYTISEAALRSSAEWVVEAPSNMSLADFDFVSFNYCTAIINGQKGTIDNGCWVNDEITMEGPNGVQLQPSVILKEGTCFQVRRKQGD